MSVQGRRYRVRGLVQGVGFRPHVWRLANTLGLSGTVRNDSAGVEIDAWGTAPVLERFAEKLRDDKPVLARVEAVEWQSLDGTAPDDGFRIAESRAGDVSTGIVPDAATCADCRAEILDAANRRYRYAFANCTHCGPRLSIVEGIPYDRARTSMREFEMCGDCASEYADPADRRFHAQPNCCPVCGPRLWLEDAKGEVDTVDPIVAAAGLLRDGRIVAVKGIGGFHLACDALNGAAVAELRRRKRRQAKPFAVMARDVAQIRQFCDVSAAEEQLLSGPAAPIVLLERSGLSMAGGIAPGQNRIGAMLPYTPLHILLMEELDSPIVLTSGNLSDEPQVIGNDEARQRLAGVADAWLLHDRAIVNRLDDSVVRFDTNGPQILRRARGMAPAPIALAAGFADTPPVLAMGAELKSTFCLLRDGQAVVSQHIGDLQDAATHDDYLKALRLYRDIYRFEPRLIAVDRHPDYHATRIGEALAAETGARIARIQHHHAHLAACLAEHGIAPGDDRSVALILDGTGLGADGVIWGGEVLVGGYDGFERAGHLPETPLPGGEQAARQPWRNAVAHLHAALGADWLRELDGTETGQYLAAKPLPMLETMVARGINSPLSTSTGRLFDAVAALLGICPDRQRYEGQAAMEMEALATPHAETAGGYPVDVIRKAGIAVPTLRPLWQALAEDLRKGAEHGIIAARFHNGLADVLASIASQAAMQRGLLRIVLSGGVMQNRLLTHRLCAALTAGGHEVLLHRLVPANDGGVSLGQAVVAARLAIAEAAG